MSTVTVPRMRLAARKRVPPLEAGDRLTRAEFERRYTAMPHLKKAELIEGVVHMPSPVSNDAHAVPHIRLAAAIEVYCSYTPGTQAGDNGTVRLDEQNEPQPDVHLRILPDHGGQTRDRNGFIEGAPELIAEVAASSVSYDLHDKLQAYRRNGVREYIVCRVWDRAIDWFVLRSGKYEPLKPDDQGVYRSKKFPGLWLDAPAILAGNMPRVLAALQAGLASPEHARFVEHLRAAQASR